MTKKSKNHQKEGVGNSSPRKVFRAEVTGRLPLTCGVNLSRRVQKGLPPPGNGPEAILGPSGMRNSFQLDF